MINQIWENFESPLNGTSCAIFCCCLAGLMRMKVMKLTTALWIRFLSWLKRHRRYGSTLEVTARETMSRAPRWRLSWPRSSMTASSFTSGKLKMKKTSGWAILPFFIHLKSAGFPFLSWSFAVSDRSWMHNLQDKFCKLLVRSALSPCQFE